MSISNHLPTKPPLGWNSWDCYGTSVREDEVRANADYMAAQLAQHGWTYIVVDIQWYEPDAQAGGYRQNANVIMDRFGRLVPAPNRFPCAADGTGFSKLADYVHRQGLKFGIHILRGIPRQAVRQNLPIFNSPFHAQDIVDTTSMCSWNDDMYGIDVSKPGAQAYYDSLIALYTDWGVDFIKADDMLWPYRSGEIEALSRAIQGVDREIVLSLSPGVDLTTDHAAHLQQHSELWRISADFWDRWEDLKSQFDICKNWEGCSGPGYWADADMLPLGHIGIRAERGVDRQSLLTRDEQITLMTLWAIFRSPLMFGGDLASMDDFTLSLLTNDEVLSVNQASLTNRELLREGDQIIWAADKPDSDEKYVAFFNIGSDPTALIELDFSLLGNQAQYDVRDLWTSTDMGVFQGKFQQQVAPHAAKLFRLRASETK